MIGEHPINHVDYVHQGREERGKEKEREREKEEKDREMERDREKDVCVCMCVCACICACVCAAHINIFTCSAQITTQNKNWITFSPTTVVRNSKWS